jgi:hypothetical protein
VQINALSLPDAPAAVLKIEIENFRLYYEDVADPAKFAKISANTTANRPDNFASVVGIADIVKINDDTVKGTASWCGRAVVFTTRR